MSVVRTGSNQRYAEGWEKIFGGATGRKPAKKRVTGAASTKSAKKKTAKKKAAARPAGRKGGRKK